MASGFKSTATVYGVLCIVLAFGCRPATFPPRGGSQQADFSPYSAKFPQRDEARTIVPRKRLLRTIPAKQWVADDHTGERVPALPRWTWYPRYAETPQVVRDMLCYVGVSERASSEQRARTGAMRNARDQVAAYYGERITINVNDSIRADGHESSIYDPVRVSEEFRTRFTDQHVQQVDDSEWFLEEWVRAGSDTLEWKGYVKATHPYCKFEEYEQRMNEKLQKMKQVIGIEAKLDSVGRQLTDVHVPRFLDLREEHRRARAESDSLFGEFVAGLRYIADPTTRLLVGGFTDYKSSWDEWSEGFAFGSFAEWCASQEIVTTGTIVHCGEETFPADFRTKAVEMTGKKTEIAQLWGQYVALERSIDELNALRKRLEREKKELVQEIDLEVPR